jgi:hypothetical protein
MDLLKKVSFNLENIELDDFQQQANTLHILEILNQNFHQYSAHQKSLVKAECRRVYKNFLKEESQNQSTQTNIGELDPKTLESQITKSIMLQKILQFTNKNPARTQGTQTFACDFSRICKYEQLFGENFLEVLEKEKPLENVENENFLYRELKGALQKMDMGGVVEEAVRDFEDYPHKLEYFDAFERGDMEMVIWCVLQEKKIIQDNLVRLRGYHELIVKYHEMVYRNSERLRRFLDRAAISYKEQFKKMKKGQDLNRVNRYSDVIDRAMS